MMNLRKEAKKTFDKITLSKKREEEILNKILRKKKTYQILKPILVSCLLLAFFTTLGITYAKDIKDTFNSLIIKQVKKEDSNGKYSIVKFKSIGIVKIKENADISKLKSQKTDKGIQYKKEDLEKELSIKMLKSSQFPLEYLTEWDIQYKDNKITRASFFIENISNELPDKITETGVLEFHRDNTMCNMYISFKTQFYKSTKDEASSFASHGTRTEEYYIKKLDTTALIIKYEQDEDSHSKVWDIHFDYKNISYYFQFYFHGTNPNTELKKFMDSLYY